MSAGPVPFVPISRQLLDSSVWEADLRVRVLWITMLMTASEPARRGTVDMTVRALAGRAAMSPEDVRFALEVLESPDEGSRTPAHDGRRLVRIDSHRDWGWRILNWGEYEAARERMLNTARKARQREREADSGSDNGAVPRRGVTVGHGKSRGVAPGHVEVEVEVEVEGEREGESSAPARRPSPKTLLETWNREKGSLPEAKGLSGPRERHARTRLGETPDLERWAAAVRRIARSPFCLGSNDRGWRATFDWLLQPDTLLKVEEGKYDPPGAVVYPEEAERRRKAEERQRQEMALQAAASAKAREFRELAVKKRAIEEQEAVRARA
jgi:hypothetical protein